jgi:hypothetical protein
MAQLILRCVMELNEALPAIAAGLPARGCAANRSPSSVVREIGERYLPLRQIA